MNLKRTIVYVFTIITMLVLCFVTTVNVLGNNSVTLTIKGAGIRTTGNAGIKFVAQIGDDEVFPEGSTHGFFVASGAHEYDDIVTSISNNLSTVNGNNLLKGTVNGNGSVFTVAIVGINTGNDETDIDRFTSDLTVLPFIELSDGSYIFSEDSCTRNIGWVAKKNSTSQSTLVQRINNLVGGQYIDLSAEELELNANVYVRSDLISGRSKYFVNGDYQEGVEFYKSLTDAVNTTVENPVIYALDNAYNDEINITKSLSLFGTGATLGSGLNVNASNVKVSNFVLGANITSESSINDMMIEKCVFNGTNIDLLEVNGLTVTNCEFTNVTNPINISVNNGTISASNNSFDYINIEVDLKKYEVKNNQNGLFNAYVLNEVGVGTIKVIVELNSNSLLENASIKLNGEDALLTEYNENSYVIEIVDERITSIDFDFDINTFEPETISDQYDISIARDSDFDDIEVTISAKEGYEFSKRLKVLVNDNEYLYEEINFSDTKLVITVNDDRITKVYLTVNVFDLHPDDYNAQVDGELCTAVLTTDKNNEYVYVTVTPIEGHEFSSDVKVYVNGKLASNSSLEITNTQIIYTEDDPNWTDLV